MIDNSEKINHHGKSANAIVKNMLQHSRANTRQKELTNINALADEYLRLAYRGMHAKEKNFNSTVQKDFYDSIKKINIVLQDIGRVLLNLFNTKPTGRGTGLGLSLSYDIIKAHGGEIKVETKEGKSSDFIISLS